MQARSKHDQANARKFHTVLHIHGGKMSDNMTEGKNTLSEREQTPVRKKAWPIYALLTGNIVSYVGNTLTLLAIPWFVLQTTNSVVQAGVVGFFSVLSMVVSGVLGGVLVERLGYKRSSAVGDLLSGLTVLLISLLYHNIGLAFWAL